jgi:hypothetical protein
MLFTLSRFTIGSGGTRECDDQQQVGRCIQGRLIHKLCAMSELSVEVSVRAHQGSELGFLLKWREWMRGPGKENRVSVGRACFLVQ